MNKNRVLEALEWTMGLKQVRVLEGWRRWFIMVLKGQEYGIDLEGQNRCLYIDFRG